MKSGSTEKSLMPTRDHVFLTWHDINFIVPMRKEAQEGLFELDDARMSLLQGHGIQSILSRNSESTLDLKSTAHQSLRNLESYTKTYLDTSAKGVGTGALTDDLAAQF